MISVRSSSSSMMLGMVRCDVLSAADNAIAVIPGVDAMTSKEGAFSLGDRACPFCTA